MLVSRASRRPRIQWTHAVCARTRQLVAAPPPASACPPRAHCLPTAILHDLCFSPASPAEQTGTRHDKPGASYTGKSSKTGMAPHDKNQTFSCCPFCLRALSGMTTQHAPPPDTALVPRPLGHRHRPRRARWKVLCGRKVGESDVAECPVCGGDPRRRWMRVHRGSGGGDEAKKRFSFFSESSKTTLKYAKHRILK